MKNFIIIAGFVLLSAFAGHKYYVSVTEVHLKPKKLEIIIRTFPDDIRNVLADTYRIEADLSQKETQKYLKLYLLNHFLLQVDGKDVFYSFSGFTTQDGFFIILLEAEIPENFSSIQLKNTILQDMFDEQKNIVHFLDGKHKKSFILTKENKLAVYKKD